MRQILTDKCLIQREAKVFGSTDLLQPLISPLTAAAAPSRS